MIRREVAALGAVGLATLALAGLGGRMAVASLDPDPDPAPAASGPVGVGDAQAISFGYLAVAHAGVRHADPSAPGAPRRGEVVVRASVTLVNTTASRQRHDPAAFALRVVGRDGRGAWLKPVHASVPAGVLQPDAAVESLLTFVAPRGSSPASLAFADPGASAPVRVALAPPRPTKDA